jgi:hypothetical protein
MISPSNTYLISVAVSNYQNYDNLQNTLKDSNDFVNLITDKYKVELYKKLHDLEANQDNLRNTFSTLKSKVSNDDSLICIFNGHGSLYSNSSHLLLSNATKEKGNGWFSWNDLILEFEKLDCKNIFAIINCCYSGNILLDSSNILANNSSQDSRFRQFFSAGGLNEAVKDSHNSGKNSPFVKHILQRLRDNTEAKLPVRNIIAYTISHFDDSDYASKPTEGYFKGHSGEEFNLFLKKDEDIIWEETLKKNSIESFESYLQKYSSGKYQEEANQSKEKLILEYESWLICNENIAKSIEHFVKNKAVENSAYQKKANDLLTTTRETIKKLTLEQNAENVWQAIKYSNNIEDFNDFKERYSATKYISECERKIDYLKSKQEQEDFWNSITKKLDIKNRKSRLSEYMLKYPNGIYFDEANQIYSDLDSWYKIENETDIKEQRKLIDTYLVRFPKGDYIANAKNKKNQIGFDVQRNKFLSDFHDAKQANNVNSIYEIFNFIEGTNDDEKIAFQEPYNLAKSWIKDYEKRLKNDFNFAIKSNKIIELNNFINQYQYAEEQIIKIEERKANLDYELFHNAKEQKNINDFQEYIDQFKDYNGFYLKDANCLIEEIKDFEKLKLKEEFQNYLENYKNPLFLNEAQEEIKNIEYFENKEKKFAEVLENKEIEKCKDFLKEYLEQDDKNKKIAELLEHLLYEQEEATLFEKIEHELEISNKLDFCNLYLEKYHEGRFKETVFSIKENQEKIIKDENNFKKALQIGNIEAFEGYVKNNFDGSFIEKAKEQIDYLKAKESNNISEIQAFKLKYPNSGNIDNANDCTFYFNATENRDVEQLQEYIKNGLDEVFKEKAIKLLQIIELEIQEEKAFIYAKENDSIFSFIKYLSGKYNKKEENEKFAKERIEQLRRIEQDIKDFENAKNIDSEGAYSKYIQSFGEKGLHYREAIKLLAEKQMGITINDKSVIERIDNQVNRFNYLENQGEDNKKLQKIIVGLLVFISLIMLFFLLAYLYKN